MTAPAPTRVPAWSRWTATVGGIGLIPLAPGTWGSAAAIPLAWLIHWAGGFWALAAATLAIFALGLIATRAYLGPRRDDPGEVVIDEVAGQMIALWPLSFMLDWQGNPAHLFPYPGWISAFLAFRFFDILKPPPVSWLDRPGAWGVMLDDVAAGILAGAVVVLAAGISHGWF